MEAYDKYKNMDPETLDNLLEGCQLIGHDWKYLFVNETVVKHSQYASKNDLLGFTMFEKYPGIKKTKLFEVLQKCMTERVSMDVESEFKFPNGSKGCFDLKIHPVPKGIFILSIDITDRKKIEMARENHLRALEKMMYMTTHKVRQPITNMLGFSEILDNFDLKQEDLCQIAEHMKKSAESLNELTKELTTFIHAQRLNVS